MKNIASNLLNHLGNSGIGGQVGRRVSGYTSARSSLDEITSKKPNKKSARPADFLFRNIIQIINLIFGLWLLVDIDSR